LFSSCYFLNPCGTTLTKVSTKQQTTDLPNVKLLDLKGNPVVVSGVVFWQIEGIKASVLNVENVYRYVNTTAMATLKQVVSKYPYEEDHDHVFDSPSGAGGSKPGLSLKTEAAQVARELKDVLQDRLAHAGVSVIAFNMTDLSYAPEIAQAMLVRQQAEAMVKARKLIVKGAVDISEDAVNQLQAKGVQMSQAEKTKVVTNLLTVICGDQRAQPTLSVS
jgi:regulator of protease activity HflC (stomatin/prohibitin superfamily)